MSPISIPRPHRALFVVTLLSAVCFAGTAHAQSFSDIPKKDGLYTVVQYLTERGILSGYADGTFRPGQKVQRAEAVKIIISSVGITDKNLKKYSKSAFSDVPQKSWFLPYVEWARAELKVIEGPPKNMVFNPTKSIQKAEFLKMLLLAQGFDPKTNADVVLPLSPDMTDTTAWYYPYVRLSLATSMTSGGTNGYLSPLKELKRSDVALLLYRLLRYKEGRRTQDLLSTVEQEILSIVGSLNERNIKAAEYASARALIAARGAQTSAPKEVVVAGALKITEAYRALVRSYRAHVDGKDDDAVKLSKDAFLIADEAQKVSGSVKTFAIALKKSAALVAKDARAHTKW